MRKLYRLSSALHQIDAKLVQQTLKEENYWKDVLRRIVPTIKLIASLGIGFREMTKANFLVENAII